MQTHTYTKT